MNYIYIFIVALVKAEFICDLLLAVFPLLMVPIKGLTLIFCPKMPLLRNTILLYNYTIKSYFQLYLKKINNENMISLKQYNKIIFSLFFRGVQEK